MSFLAAALAIVALAIIAGVCLALPCVNRLPAEDDEPGWPGDASGDGAAGDASPRD